MDTTPPQSDKGTVAEHPPHSALIGIGLVLGIALLTLVLLRTVGQEQEMIGCTMEALVCPDGSAVGREGRACTFTPCPPMEELRGTLVRDENGVGLLVENALTGEMRMPLIVRVSNALADFEGREVVVRGTFTEGSTYTVDSLELAEEGIGDAARDVRFAGVGETASVGDLKVTLNEVVQDNRCPTDVECIEGGAITANVTFTLGEREKTFTMPSDEVPQEFEGYRISIAEVLPEALSTVTIAPSDYRVGFRIEETDVEETPLTPNP